MARHYMHRIFDNFGRTMSLPDCDIYDKTSGMFTDEYLSRIRLDLQSIRKAIEERSTLYIVEDITERNSLYGLVSGNMCFVKDATDDTTVLKGSASYIARIYIDNVVWDKIFETESLDRSLFWDIIQDRPSSTVEDIDNMVSEVHDTPNMEVLNNIRVSENGNLLYNNKEHKFYPGIIFKKGEEVLGTKMTVISEIVL